ncbi:MAG: hypothetical protein AB8B85_00940 [Paracoccaceae bacterium]
MTFCAMMTQYYAVEVESIFEVILRTLILAALGFFIAACAPQTPKVPTFLAGNIVSTEVTYASSREIIASGLNEDYARAQGLKKLRAPGRGGEESDEFAEQNAEFDRVARSPEAAKWARDQILKAVTEGVVTAAPGLSRSEPDAVLKFEIVSVGVNMVPFTVSKFRSNPLTIQHGIIGRVTLLDPASRDAIWGPLEIASVIRTRQQVPAKQILGALRSRLTRQLLEGAATCPLPNPQQPVTCYTQ